MPINCGMCRDYQAGQDAFRRELAHQQAEATEQIKQQQVIYDALFDLLYEDEKKIARYPMSVADDPAARAVESKLGPRPITPQEKEIATAFAVATFGLLLVASAVLRGNAVRESPLYSAKSGAPSTGVPFLDRLAVGTKEYESWSLALNRRGYSIIVDETLSAAARVERTASFDAATGQWAGGIVRVNPSSFTHLDLLHESRHLEQLRLGSLFGKNMRSGALGNWAELDAYAYERKVLNALENAKPGSRAFGQLNTPYNRSYLEWYRQNVLPKHQRSYGHLPPPMKQWLSGFWSRK